MEKAKSTDDIKKKYQKTLNEWKKKQAELPVRIDEAEKQKVEIDVVELELQKNALNEKIAENKAKQEDISKEFDEQQKASDGVIELRMELNGLQQKANESLDNKRREIRRELDDLDFQMKEVKHQIRLNKQDIQSAEDSIKRTTTQIQICRQKWSALDSQVKAENERVFDENSLVCSCCGQEYPEDRKEQLRAEFDSHKTEEIKRLESERAAVAERGNGLKAAIDKDKAEIEQLKATLKENEDEEINLLEAIKGLEKSLEEVPQSVEISDRPEVREINRQIAEKEASMSKGNSVEEIRKKLKSEGEELQKQMDAVKEQLVLVKKNDEADDRIAELQKEQREVAQKVADQEKMLFLLEEFIRFKMDMVSDTINQKLDGICVKLFERQINSGIRECCELTYNGVPYQSLNSGHRIVAGLKIIKALQEFYGIYAPIFVDNAESLNDFNLPEMNCQLITLSVTEDKELKVVIGE